MEHSAENFETFSFLPYAYFDTPLVWCIIFRAPTFQLFWICIPLPFNRLLNKSPKPVRKPLPFTL